MRKRVYLAGPIGRGDLLHNVNQATAAFVALAKAGFAPFCPHWSVYSKPCYRPVEDNTDLDGFFREEDVICEATVTGNDGMSYADWMDVDLPWVVASDALLRLPGESTGADLEESCARDHDIPVFHDIPALVAHFSKSE